LNHASSPAADGLYQLKLFLALSRTAHGLIDMTTPALGALLWLGGLPPVPRTLVGLLTAFAGYTAVYALNDVVDYHADREKLARTAAGAPATGGADLDAALVRHPLAQGLLSFHAGLVWALAWAAVALSGALWLNPVCGLVFVGGCLLEALYCRLWRISPLRTVISGMVKSAGAIAGVLAVDPQPDRAFVLFLFLTLFFWEIGGQNVPNDWADLESDRQMGARTIPVAWGLEAARGVIVLSSLASLAGLAMVFHLSAFRLTLWPGGAGLAVAALLVLAPVGRLVAAGDARSALRLFNRASLLPPALLLVVVLRLVLG
jgi:4-hydroxybenzoate polyprenyltransferase